MEIKNGRWVDSNEERLCTFNYDQFKQLSNNVTSLYGKDITYERISLIGRLKSLTRSEERIVKDLLGNTAILSKL